MRSSARYWSSDGEVSFFLNAVSEVSIDGVHSSQGGMRGGAEDAIKRNCMFASRTMVRTLTQKGAPLDRLSLSKTAQIRREKTYW